MSQQPIHISEFTVESDNVVYTDERIASRSTRRDEVAGLRGRGATLSG